jgi:hypothetical protein
MTKIGVISDTHGHLHPHLATVFAGVDLILHAGDVGGLEITARLEEIAPVQAVRGNVDHGLLKFPLRRLVWVEQVAILVTHLGLWSAALSEWLQKEHDLERPDVFVYGHTHRAAHRREDGLLWFNPGTAGRSRAGMGTSVGLLEVQGKKVTGHIVRLNRL